MKKNPQSYIDTSKIPDYVRYELLSVIYDATVAYFQQPGVSEKYELWKAAKEATAKRTVDTTPQWVDMATAFKI